MDSAGTWIKAKFAAAAVLLGLLMLSTGCNTPASQKSPLRLKVMTYNIRIGAGGGEWPSDPAKINLEPVAQLVSAHAPDILGLQEVDQFRPRSARMNQPVWLSERLNLNMAFAEAYSVKAAGAPDEKYGVALLADHPILPHLRFPLFKPDYSQSHPQYPDYFSEQRVLLYAPLEVGHRKIHVFVTHLGLTADQRQEQIKQIAEITARYPGPKLLMGDFNAQPDEPAMKLLEPNFRDALNVVETTPEARKSFPAGMQPRSSIDYIFISPEFRALNARVIRDATLASDHNPVIAELELLP